MSTTSKTDFLSPPSLRHVALKVRRFEQCLDFYTKLIGYRCEWQPDASNVYLSCGDDNLALHRVDPPEPQALAPVADAEDGRGALDHIGFFLIDREQVDRYYQRLSSSGVKTDNPPRQHRDGAYSFYCWDPDGNCLQFIYHAPVSNTLPTDRQPPTSN